MILCGLGGGFLQPFCNSRDLLTQHPMDSRSAHQMALRQLTQALPLLAITEDGGPIEDQSLPPDMPSFELGPPHAGAHPLDDQAAFQFGDCADDYDYCPTQRPAGVDLFAEADELDV